jgi:hypothetical protein
MAEIKIEKKNYAWVWILLGIIIVGLILYFLMRDDRETEYHETDTDTTTQQIYNGDNSDNAVNNYLGFISNDDSLGRNHEYSSEALSRLADAIREKAGQVNYDISADLEKADEYANRITNDPAAASHSQSIKNAADILTNAMQNLQNAHYPDLNNEMQEVSNAASKINPKILTLNQREAIKDYFNKSGDLLRNMNKN